MRVVLEYKKYSGNLQMIQNSKYFNDFYFKFSQYINKLELTIGQYKFRNLN